MTTQVVHRHEMTVWAVLSCDAGSALVLARCGCGFMQLRSVASDRSLRPAHPGVAAVQAVLAVLPDRCVTERVVLTWLAATERALVAA